MGSISTLLAKVSERFIGIRRITNSSECLISSSGVPVADGIGSYLTEFASAIERALRLGVATPQPLIFTATPFITTEKIELAIKSATQHLGLLRIDDISGQCLSLHLRLLPILEQVFSCPVYYTIGYVEAADGFMFGHNEEYLVDLLKTKKGDLPCNLHSWLTLPSGEIIDASLPTTFAKVNEDRSIPLGSIICNDANVLRNCGLHYRPTIVGVDFLFKAGIAVVEPVPLRNSKA